MVTDSKGVEYQTNEYKVLVRAPQQLVSYTVPKSCEEILGGSKDSDSPFYFCSSNIETIYFEADSNLQKIGQYSFAALKKLSTIDFHNCQRLQTINDNSFVRCTSLNKVVLPPKLLTFKSYCFYYCSSLKSLSIPDSVTSFGYKMIEGSGLETLEISMNSNMENMNSESLCKCPLKSLFIPRNVTQIDGSVIMRCDNLSSVTIHEDNTNFKIIGKCLYTSDEKKLVLTWETGDLIVPYKVTQLGFACFRSSRITSVSFSGQTMTSFEAWFCSGVSFPEFHFPKGIKIVPGDSFCYSSIVSVYLTEEVNVIKARAFQNCKLLQNIILLNVTTIQNSAFLYCTSLKNISLPPMLETIEQSAFGHCDSLTVDASQNSKFGVTNGMLFIDQKKTLSEYFGDDTSIVVPEFCTNIGRTAFASKSIERISFNSSTTLSLSSYAFDESQLKEIELPKCLKSIGEYCFNRCYKLEKVTFDDECSLSMIPDQCFYSCTSLKEINIPRNVQKICNESFLLCSKLKTLDLKQTRIESIGESAFSQSGVTRFEFPQTLVSIGDNSFEKCDVKSVDFSQAKIASVPKSCFSECKSLESIIFSDSTETINILAFNKCQSLKNITLPYKISTVETHSFTGCLLLESVILKKNCMLKTIKPRAFANCPNLIKLVVDEDDEKFIFEKGALLSKNRTDLTFFLPSSKTTVFVVPSTVKTVGTSAFEECTNLQMIIFPDNGTSKIEFRAFAGCTRLKYVHLPDSLTSIGEQAFEGCERLKCGSIYTSNLDSIKEMLQNIGVDPIAYSTNCSSVHTAHRCAKKSFSPVSIIMLVMSQ